MDRPLQLSVTGESDMRYSKLRGFVLSVVLVAFWLSGCGAEKPETQNLTRSIPSIPAASDFGPLYPRLAQYLSSEYPDIPAAMRITRDWAAQHLDGFALGACSTTQVVNDAEFTRIYGRGTLGVTLPWMQIYIRDGVRDPEPFVWKDPSLFVSTVLHEYMHAIQRAKQAHEFLGTGGDCNAAIGSLTQRYATWSAGFAALRVSATLGSSFAGPERTLLYRWISPIERARDEVDAALATVRWMDAHSEELNIMTPGGANNWAYAVQFLQQLGNLAKSNCFSPDEDTYRREMHIYEVEMPAYMNEARKYEQAMKYFLAQHQVPTNRLNVADINQVVAPTGREGARCNSSALSELPRYPFGM